MQEEAIKLRKYIDGLFADTVPSRKAVELKEEMIQNLSDKYADLITEGKPPEAAYNIAVASVGDISHLLRELDAEAAYTPSAEEFEAARRRSAMLTAIAVMTYILSILPIIFLSNRGYGEEIGLPVMLVMCAGATGLLVYNGMTKPRAFSHTETIVESFREWQTVSNDRRTLRRSISAALWSIITAAYFIISFNTGDWHITWIIFLVGAALEAFINIFFALKK